MSELQRLLTTDWERRGLAETADAMAHIYPDRTRVIRELLSDYDVLRGETANLTAKNERLTAERDTLRAAATAALDRLHDLPRFLRANDVRVIGEIVAEVLDSFRAATATTGEESAR
jgi:hypothetical protein